MPAAGAFEGKKVALIPTSLSPQFEYYRNDHRTQTTVDEELPTCLEEPPT